MSSELAPDDAGQQGRALPIKYDEDVVRSLDDVFEKYMGAAERTDLSLGGRALVTAIAVLEVKHALSQPPVVKILRALEGTAIGFKTGHKQPVDEHLLVDCCTLAILHGLPLLGNHFNILFEGFYITQEGYTHKVVQLARYSVSFKTARISDEHRESGGHVCVEASGFYSRRLPDGSKGPTEKLIATYNVRMTKRNQVAEENAEGKAKRKWLKDIYRILVGQALAGDDFGDPALPNGQPQLPAKRGFKEADFADPAERTISADPDRRWEQAKETDTEVDEPMAAIVRWKHVQRLRDAEQLGEAEKQYGPRTEWPKAIGPELVALVSKVAE